MNHIGKETELLLDNPAGSFLPSDPDRHFGNILPLTSRLAAVSLSPCTTIHYFISSSSSRISHPIPATLGALASPWGPSFGWLSRWA